MPLVYFYLPQQKYEPKKQQAMETTNSKTVFVEYSYARKGQHFMTVVQNLDLRRVIIGRIYRDYDPSTKRSTYRAYDYEGNQVFDPTASIEDLKTRFKKSGRYMAEGVIASRQVANQQHVRFPYEQPGIRIKDIKRIREIQMEKNKEKRKEVRNQRNAEKNQNKQIEKVLDEKNQTVKKDNPVKVEENPKQGEVEKREVNAEELKQEERNVQNESTQSEREMEIEAIRGNQEERDQDREIEM